MKRFTLNSLGWATSHKPSLRQRSLLSQCEQNPGNRYQRVEKNGMINSNQNWQTQLSVTQFDKKNNNKICILGSLVPSLCYFNRKFTYLHITFLVAALRNWVHGNWSGWHVCRTKFPRKLLNSRTKIGTKIPSKKGPKRLQKFKPCSGI